MTARKHVVLVVEDDRFDQHLILEMLGRMELPLDIETVPDGQAALDILAQREVDLICLDLILPNISGFEVCELIRKSLGLDTPILITSHRCLPEDRALAEETGANGYVTKPLKAPILHHEVRRLLKLDLQLVGS
jgi:two-component system chemotaxis response regulator CheY